MVSGERPFTVAGGVKHGGAGVPVLRLPIVLPSIPERRVQRSLAALSPSAKVVHVVRDEDPMLTPLPGERRRERRQLPTRNGLLRTAQDPYAEADDGDAEGDRSVADEVLHDRERLVYKLVRGVGRNAKPAAWATDKTLLL